jgi:hypothetical protein
MPKPLKLTITAVGEPNSVFMQPCDPITLHESEIETEDVHEDAFASPDDSMAEPAEAVDDDPLTDRPGIFILAEDAPLPRHRRGS